jgi:hypothetical protein
LPETGRQPAPYLQSRRRFGAMMSNILRYGWKPKEAMQAL